MNKKQEKIICNIAIECFLQVLKERGLISIIEYYELKNFELCQQEKQKFYL